MTELELDKLILRFKQFNRAEDRFLLFRSKRSTIERFDPPVDIVITRQRKGKGPRTFQIN